MCQDTAALNVIMLAKIERVIRVKPLKEKVSITLDSDIVEKIKQLAEEDERSFSQYINKVLKDYLKNSDKK